ncbi:MAG: UDP:flavonoid glycosyltransferase YjiC (YdhE family) [Flavobacteriales bacterium]
MKNQPRILIAPLDWGLGHTTRVIPIIRSVIESGATPVIAGNIAQLEFLNSYFPDFEYHLVEGYDVVYGKNVARDIAIQLNSILKSIKRERKWLDVNISNFNVQAIISDNRYGMRHSSVPSVLITHQIHVAGPKLANGILEMLSKKHLAAFDHIWVPDYTGNSALAGKLSNSDDERVSYLGPLSRFEGEPQTPTPETDVKLFGIVSGPEDQRTFFENDLIELFKRDGRKAIIARGRKDLSKKTDGNVQLIPHVKDELFRSLVAGAEVVICRSGYSTIMDLAHLERKAIVVATPGQGEQEYIAQRLEGKHGFRRVAQGDLKDINLSDAAHLPLWRIMERENTPSIPKLIQDLTRK